VIHLIAKTLQSVGITIG